ncbi:bifunctional folylpolyglutamate synthase/dihydrofolate synthase [Sediminicola arcticus]|jgi:dihydrofolate synthase/folylpolyglutamate synthase|uniref:Dihydrofolate synthase/folylpolyglutamate synthase n=1 Tax=Sediminicola arcticus TaxID=1574308 RepID=A0ABV2ST96_9FLAO
MGYQETLDWMFAQLPMYQQKGKSAFNGKLDNILKLVDHLNHPEKNFKTIHVAGTNGKGSSSHMLASVLQEAGYKVGLYTSPHLKDFRERIKINGIQVDKDYVITFIEKNKMFLSENKLSFFEMTVGMAFDFFAIEQVDIAIIEVGLGGRLDSTNIIIPEVSLITNIGLDHMDILGSTLSQIASEKAGIIKPNVPVVISEYQQEIASVFMEAAQSRDAVIVFAAKEELPDYISSLLGNYQKMNVKGVLATLKLLKGYNVNEEHIKAGLLKVAENTGLMGRWQVLGEKPLVICDTAHNSEGFAVVLQQIHQQKYNALHLVLGFVKEKNLEAILPLFPKEASYYFCAPQIERKLDEWVLKEKASEFGLVGEVYNSVNEALVAAKQIAKSSDLIYVGGSNFVVAEVV